MPRAIIPAAGFGTRLSMEPHQSKELLPGLDGRPMIQNSIDLARERGWNPLVVTREEKKDLLDYCWQEAVEVLVIQPHGEWPNTILASAHRWEDENLLLLPDTVFAPPEAVADMLALTKRHPITIGIHKVSDPCNWCVYDALKEQIIEKPMAPHETWWGMGLLGWQRLYGKGLFQALATRNNPYPLPSHDLVFLDSFKDLTR